MVVMKCGVRSRAVLEIGIFFNIANPLAQTYLNEANKLDAYNYVNSKFKMRTLLECYGSWTITKGEEEKPIVGATTASIQDLEKWEKK